MSVLARTAPRWMVLAWLASACSSAGAPTPLPTAGGGTLGTLAPTASIRLGGALSCADPFEGEDIAFSLAGWSETDFCRHSIDFAEVVSGGQPRDGIPPIDSPVYESVDSASAWMEDGWPVIALVGSQEVLAFPLPILVWHEVVNTVIEETPVTVTYSPMSASARVFAGRSSSGTPLVFGTTGNLRFGNSILYDRSIESWWQQLGGEAIAGESAGSVLEAFPAPILAWSRFRAEFPQGRVLSRETGTLRDYGHSPYAGIEGSAELPTLVRAFVVGEGDGRLGPTDRVVGLLSDSGAIAYPMQALATARVVNHEANGQPMAVFWQPGALSVTDAALISESRDVGSSAVYLRDLEGQVLTFEWSQDEIRDRETGSTWSLTGLAVAGPLQGRRLSPLVSVEAYWFAWSAIYPETAIWAP
ncbi:MAG TPA: DUF3179 domain-containing protein [Anaerolineales bacterium]|nr:DUF3179 domain-containing protein [Anaerolineales bacterium]